MACNANYVDIMPANAATKQRELHEEFVIHNSTRVLPASKQVGLTGDNGSYSLKYFF